MRESLIYILFERNIHRASANIDEIFRNKISDERLAVYDLDEQGVIYDYYICEDTIDEAIEEAEDFGLDFLRVRLVELKKVYDERREKLKEIYRRHEDEREYAIYLKVKQRIENGEKFGEEK